MILDDLIGDVVQKARELQAESGDRDYRDAAQRDLACAVKDLKLNVLGGVVTLGGDVAPAKPLAAKISPDEVAVRHSVRPDVQREFLTIECPNGWDDVKKLVKKVLIFDNRRFTFTGWCSDRNVCFFARPTPDALGVQEPRTAKIVRR